MKIIVEKFFSLANSADLADLFSITSVEICEICGTKNSSHISQKNKRKQKSRNKNSGLSMILFFNNFYRFGFPILEIHFYDIISFQQCANICRIVF